VVPNVKPEHEELLRRLALNDEVTAETVLGTILRSPDETGLHAKTHALARVAALVAAESALASYLWAVASALAAGASEDDIVDVLIAVAPIVGLARLAAAAPQLAVALGYDVAPTSTA
jgi:4-carboxymuconolactone decarboxylase